MNRLVCGVIFCFLLSVGAGRSEGADRPNIVFLFADDQRVDTIAAPVTATSKLHTSIDLYERA